MDLARRLQQPLLDAAQDLDHRFPHCILNKLEIVYAFGFVPSEGAELPARPPAVAFDLASEREAADFDIALDRVDRGDKDRLQPGVTGDNRIVQLAEVQRRRVVVREALRSPKVLAQWSLLTVGMLDLLRAAVACWRAALSANAPRRVDSLARWTQPRPPLERVKSRILQIRNAARQLASPINCSIWSQ